MRYDQVDVALEFLLETKDITLQVGYAKDTMLLRAYLIKRLGNPDKEARYRQMSWVWYGEEHRITFEVVNGNEWAGVGRRDTFYIERKNIEADWSRRTCELKYMQMEP